MTAQVAGSAREARAGEGAQPGERQAKPPPAGLYRERAGRFDREAAGWRRRTRLLGRARLALFVVAVAGVWGLWGAGSVGAAGIVAAAAAVLFSLLVVRHRAARLRLRRAELMADFNREGVRRIAREWPKLPAMAAATAAASDLRSHDYATDLDLFGHASLLHLTGVCGTAPGWQTLRSWLLGRADPATVRARQEAVREMAAAFDFRDRLAAEARLVAEGMRGGGEAARGGGEGAAASAAAFLAWAEGDPWLPRHRLLRLCSFILPPVNVAAIALWAAGVAPVAVVGWSLVLSTLVLTPHRKAIYRQFTRADDGESGLRSLAPLLGHLLRAPLQSPLAAAIRDRLGKGRHSAPREIATLRRLLDMADLRRSPLFHLPLALVLHWDLHVLAALERWQARSGPHARDWLRATGEMEALSSLATLAADHPDWTMPTLDPHARTLRARALGHPLLPPANCVRNDIEAAPPGSFLLVTGSNMSGKSTLLRAIGLNAVLAQAGAPVCATSLTLPPLRVVTSMRIDDSLADGVSFFMAELRRLKRVVDAARQSTDRPTRPARAPHPGDSSPRDFATGATDANASPTRVLFLLDEILQGTNSAERRIAARTVIRLLLQTGAVGAITTHDLGLADADDLMARASLVHFRESVEEPAQDTPGGGLSFDYRLRDGIATSTNALKLLGLVGLGEEG